ncbi:MAG: hypothetical protein UV38_C0001G0123 [candidate division TM6 bacterium GW2011_GWE2_42_60]|nr:MAG: hypothetical protein UV38_C0001G0123 [candidate division TM6 bacterium GW2011_GWE2_42_60]HBY05680.1 hypothetical protein [Candidatus Dependentiae bacterium]
MKLTASTRRIISVYLLPTITGLFLILLLSIALHRYSRDAKLLTNQLLADNIEQLTTIFKRIDEKCKIIDFEHEKNFVDFLNVKGFTGSEVGAMNLAAAEAWEGPYLPTNPTVQDKNFVIVETAAGYYLAPGDGITLANGKIIGKDIILNKDTNFEKLIQDPTALQYNGRPLAALIKK